MYLILSKQINRVVRFRNDVSQHRRVSTTKHPASIMMVGIVASNAKKMPPVWFAQGYMLSKNF